MNHGQLGRRLWQISEAEKQLIISQTKAELELLSKSLIIVAEAELHIIRKDISSKIQSQRAKIKTLIMVGWIPPLLVGVMLTAGLAIGNWGLARHYSHQIVELSTKADQARQTLAQLEAWEIQLIENDQGRYMVLPEGLSIVPGWSLGGKPAYKITQK